MTSPSRDYARLSGLGIEFALLVGFFVWLGHLADARWKLLGSFPAFLLLGAALGLTAGIWRLQRQLAAWQRDAHEGKDAQDGPDRPTRP